MIEGLNIAAIIEIVSRFGTLGVLVIVWWNDRKTIRDQAEAHKREMAIALERYKEDMVEQRKMYANNVKLVETTQNIAGDLKEVVIMNTQCWQKVSDAIEDNQFCPMVRLDKRARGVTNE